MATDSRNGSRGDEVTHLLRSWRQGDGEALDRLLPLVHAELRRVARSHIRREGAGHTLEATALVHEVYLRLVGLDRLTLNDRTHFFALAATLMRQVLVDHARRKRRTNEAERPR
jgi:RNA polymerase sigma factor (TIGR02999 family)